MDNILIWWSAVGFIIWLAIQCNKKLLNSSIRKEVIVGIACGPIVMTIMLIILVLTPFYWALDRVSKWLDDA